MAFETSPTSEEPIVAAVEPTAETPTQTTTDVIADPSPATDAKDAPATSLLDVVRNVVEPKVAKEPEAPSAAEAEKPADGAEPEAPPELTDAEIAELPFHKHPRFVEVLNQKNAFKADLAEATTRVQELEGPAEQWTNVREFMSTNNLSDEDMLDGFKMMAMVRMDPLQGRAAIAAYLSELDTALGLSLPDDLREQVDGGYISEALAGELSKARATDAARVAAATADTERQQRETAATEAQTVSTALTTAAATWETAKRAKDPDFEAKSDLIADRMRSIAQAERLTPRTPDEINALLERAHKDVTANLRRFVPKPKEQARPTTASAATVAVSAPSTMREAMARAAQG